MCEIVMLSNWVFKLCLMFWIYQETTLISIPPRTTPIMLVVCSEDQTMPLCLTGNYYLIFFFSFLKKSISLLFESNLNIKRYWQLEIVNVHWSFAECF